MSFDFDNYEKFARDLSVKYDAKEVVDYRNAVSHNSDYDNYLAKEVVDYRNAVSRGYYSLYHKVKKHYGYTDGEIKRHEDLIKDLKNDEELKFATKLSHYMQTFKTEREHADYRRIQGTKVFNKTFCDGFWLRYDWFVKSLKIEKEE